MSTKKLSPLKSRPQIGLLLRLPYLELEKRVAEGLAAAGFDDFRPAHNQALQHLSPEGSRLTELAAAANITKQSMQQLVEHLVKCGYLRRAADPQDNRAQLLFPTRRAEKVYAAVERIIDQVEHEWAQAIGQAEFKRLQQLLEALCKSAV